ncbi:MAG: peptidylprolyl isomerase [Candidatus Doudnabacteria bacterium]|nr:peptidylprolyl isomerase [Candidatus Doudnabacteria bacterium]
MTLKTKKILFITGSVVVVLFLISLFLVYGAGSTDPITKFFKKVYPAMVVGDEVMSVYDFEHYQTLAANLDSSASAGQIRNQMIKNLQAQALARKLNVFPTDSQVSAEEVFIVKNKQSEFQDVLAKYFALNKLFFEKLVVTPSAVSARLAIKYNSAQPKNKLEQILAKIKSGEKFEDLAKTNSDDGATGQFGGDMGFFERGEILPELEAFIINAPMGSVYEQIIITRLGRHIIYPVETADVDGTKKWHAKHILLRTDGYDDWFTDQVSEIRVWQIFR